MWRLNLGRKKMEAGCRGRLSGMKGWRRCFHEQSPDHPGSLCFSLKKKY